eukprot:9509230-Lingulodinium_polyedra.AAC.1
MADVFQPTTRASPSGPHSCSARRPLTECLPPNRAQSATRTIIASHNLNRPLSQCPPCAARPGNRHVPRLLQP